MTSTEWALEGGGYKEKKTSKGGILPFYCCALSLQPFESPVCNRSGVIFDILSVNKNKNNEINQIIKLTNI